MRSRPIPATTHQYLNEPAGGTSGTYPITVTVTDSDTQAAVGSTNVTVTNVAPSAIGLTLHNATLNEGGSTWISGTFADAGTQDIHTVDVNWGDGTAHTTIDLAAGVLSFSSASNPHTYTEEGPYTVTVTVTDEDGESASASTAATVNDVQVVVSPLSLSAATGVGFIGVATATFVDPPGAEGLSSYSASINWGDSTPVSTGTITYDSVNHRFTVTGSHTYATTGSYTVTTTVTHEAMTPVAVTSTATVGPATWANDTWLEQIDVDGVAGVIGFGDIVRSNAYLSTPGEDTAVSGLVYGVNAFSTIQAAINGVAATGTAYVLSGNYSESNITITKGITIDGQDRAGVVLHSLLVDSHEDSSFGGAVVSNGFVIGANDVTIKDLSIDGQAGQNFRNGIITDYNAGVYGNIDIDNVSMSNIYRKGVGLYVIGTGHTVGNSVTNSFFDHIGTAAALGFEGNGAIAIFQADTVVDNNEISYSAAGILSNYFNAEAQAPRLTVTNNRISNPLTYSLTNPAIGMDLSGLADGSIIGGPALSGDANTIDMTGGTNHDIGIAVQYAVADADITVQGNTLTMGRRGHGHSSVPEPVLRSPGAG